MITYKDYKEFFEFLCDLIDIQIKKYEVLAKIGVGPDARLNAKLIFDEVNELLGFAEQLLMDMIEIEAKSTNEPVNPTSYSTIFNQVKFYIEQEYVRARAGWLLDANNIHTPGVRRVQQQLETLHQMALSKGIDCSASSKPATEIQKQCEYDSYAIAFYILNLAKKIKENPSMELNDSIPPHAQNILRRNASTRYSQFAKSIDALHKKYDEFLKSSDRGKSSTSLLKDEAQCNAQRHRTIREELWTLYQTKIQAHPKEKIQEKPIYSSGNFRLFGGIAAASAVVIYMLIEYFAHLDNENALNTLCK